MLHPESPSRQSRRSHSERLGLLPRLGGPPNIASASSRGVTPLPAARLALTLQGVSRQGAPMVVPTWLVIGVVVILVLILILLVVISYRVNAHLRHPACGIGNVTLRINPRQARRDTTNAFLCTVQATGWATNETPRDYSIQLIDHDPMSDDLLEVYESPSSTTGGIHPRPMESSRWCTWSITKTLNLSCDPACIVYGRQGSSGETDPAVFARLRIGHGNPNLVFDSQQVTITCASESGDDGAGNGTLPAD